MDRQNRKTKVTKMSDQNGWPEGFEDWINAGSCGASANSIAAHLVGHGKQDGAYPHDEGDFRRCERLLDAAPSIKPNLHRMAEVNAYWAALVTRWDQIRQSDNKTALIKEIITPIQNSDPGHVQISPVASMRVGPNNYAGDGIEKSMRDSHEKHRQKQGKPPMKHDPEFQQAADKAYRVTADELRQFIERFERLEMEKKDIADQQKEVMAEAKGRGYDTKIIRKIIALRKKSSDEIAEEEAILDTYKQALGMT